MRYLWVDQTRLIAAYAVISIHAFSSLYKEFDTAASSDWWFANFVITIGKSIANPIYAMISGYLILGRDTQPRPFLKTQASRLLPVLAFWSIFYGLFTLAIFDTTWFDFIWQITFGLFFKGHAYFHLWYLSTFIMLMLFAPFINQWIKGQSPSRQDIFLLLIIVAGIFTLNSVADLKKELTESTFIMGWHTSFAWYLAYFVLGYYIGRKNLTAFIPAHLLILVFVVTFLFCFFGNFLLASQGTIRDNLIVSNTGIFGFIMAVCAFSLFSRRAPERESSPQFRAIATTSFGVYLIHPAILYAAVAASKHLIDHLITQLLVATLLTLIGSIFVIYLFRKTSIGRRLT